MLLPAIKPDVALFHAPMADREGNVWIGRQRELVTMAHAAERTIVTVEKMHDGNLLDDPTLAAGTLPGFYVEQVAVAERGCWPLPLPEYYAWDAEHLKEYVALAATDEGFAKYLDKYVHEKPPSSSTRSLPLRSLPLEGEGVVAATSRDEQTSATRNCSPPRSPT